MKVLKFGGTSVGTTERMRHVAQLINDGESKIVVLSAMSGTTNRLVEIDKLLNEQLRTEAKEHISQLFQLYKSIIKDLLSSGELRKEGERIINHHFDQLFALANMNYHSRYEKEILAQGELLSTQLFCLYLKECHISSALISALDFMRTDKDGEPDEFYIRQGLKRELDNNKGVGILITQGFICRNVFGELDNLKRGGSDYTASLIGAAADVSEIQIWTDIDGLHNNDPRYVQNTTSLSRVSFEEAAELAYFGAKILHPSSVAPAKAKSIPVLLKNTMNPKAPGTRISSEAAGGGIQAIAAKDGITAINIHSSKMLMAHGFLHKVFEVFKNNETSVDMITTSEVALSLTIDDDSRLVELVEDLKNYARVAVDKDLSIICVVGDLIGESKGYAFKIFKALQHIPIRMISYGGSKHNISLLVKTSDKIEALRALHQEVFD